MSAIGVTLILLGLLALLLLLVSVFSPAKGGFWMVFLKEKTRIKVIGINLVLFLALNLIYALVAPPATKKLSESSGGLVDSFSFADISWDDNLAQIYAKLDSSGLMDTSRSSDFNGRAKEPKCIDEVLNENVSAGFEEIEDYYADVFYGGLNKNLFETRGWDRVRFYERYFSGFQNGPISGGNFYFRSDTDNLFAYVIFLNVTEDLYESSIYKSLVEKYGSPKTLEDKSPRQFRKWSKRGQSLYLGNKYGSIPTVRLYFVNDVELEEYLTEAKTIASQKYAEEHNAAKEQTDRMF